MERNEWVTTLEKAISEHKNRQLSFSNIKFDLKNSGCNQLKLGYKVNINII